jgi:predicted secreted protein
MITSILRFLLIYIVFWWLFLFMLLPIKAHPPKKPGKGHATSAPEKTYLGYKALAASLMALVCGAVATYYLDEYGYF